MTAPTGEQIVLEREGARATVGTVAAVLRELVVDGVALTETFSVDAAPPFAAGIVLAPWPNRVADAVWRLDGVEQALDVTEPARGNAIHGLLRNTDYAVVQQDAASVTLRGLIPPQHGWPFLLVTTVRYALRADGLDVTHTATNHATTPAPWALGTHPFLRVGEVPVADLTLTVHAGTRLEADDRLIPRAEHPVDGTPFDLRAGRRVGELDLDTTFGAVAPVGGVSARLEAPDGSVVELRQEASWGYLQVFTPRAFPRDDGPGLAVAVEPMTAPPDALNSGDGLAWIEPGATWEGSWGLRYRGGIEGE